MSDDVETSNKAVISSDDFMSIFFQTNIHNFDADNLNNLYNFYLHKDPYFNNSSETSFVDDEGLRKYSDNSNDYNNFCHTFNESGVTSRKNSLVVKSKIFKTEKTKKKRGSEEIDKRLLKKIRNKMAAKKCRDNKKHFMDNLIVKMRQVEEELKLYKELFQDTKVIYHNLERCIY
jgi:hypothetical protein